MKKKKYFRHMGINLVSIVSSYAQALKKHAGQANIALLNGMIWFHPYLRTENFKTRTKTSVWRSITRKCFTSTSRLNIFVHTVTLYTLHLSAFMNYVLFVCGIIVTKVQLHKFFETCIMHYMRRNETLDYVSLRIKQYLSKAFFSVIKNRQNCSGAMF